MSSISSNLSLISTAKNRFRMKTIYTDEELPHIMERCCLVTICIGEKYLQQYNMLFRASHEKYAKKCGYDFKIITDFIKEPRHFSVISFNKVLVCDYNWSSEYDFIIFVDADVIINENAPFNYPY